MKQETDERNKAVEAFEKVYDVMRKWGNERDISSYKYDLDGLFKKIVKYLEQATWEAKELHRLDLEELGLTQSNYRYPRKADACCPCCGAALLKAESVIIKKALPHASKQDDTFHDNPDALTAFICLNCSRVYVPK